MIPYPAIECRIAGVPGEIRPESSLWHLPLSERAFDSPRRDTKPAGDASSSITIGDYFLAARDFLLNDGCRMLGKAFWEQTGKRLVSHPRPLTLSLSLEKHGVFYHPVKVVIKNNDNPLCVLVLNGAVSEPGLALIEEEHLLLSGILGQVALPVFPRVYGQAMVDCGKGDIGFFLGEWFEGFCEFHVSIRNGHSCIAVWGEQGEVKYFSLDEAAHIYESISFVLTSAYNLETCEQIFPWHHAAGDFIVDPDRILTPSRDGLAVKLITVRGYGVFSVFERDEENKDISLLVGLLIFFLNLSIRMQLDKVDGIGETVFLGETVLKATLAGFIKGLDAKEASGCGDLKQAFAKFISGFTPEQLLEILDNILEPLQNETRERALIQTNLKGHCRSLYAMLKTQYLQDFY